MDKVRVIGIWVGQRYGYRAMLEQKITLHPSPFTLHPSPLTLTTLTRRCWWLLFVGHVPPSASWCSSSPRWTCMHAYMRPSRTPAPTRSRPPSPLPPLPTPLFRPHPSRSHPLTHTLSPPPSHPRPPHPRSDQGGHSQGFLLWNRLTYLLTYFKVAIVKAFCCGIVSDKKRRADQVWQRSPLSTLNAHDSARSIRKYQPHPPTTTQSSKLSPRR